jgi:flavodoxin
MASTTRRNFLAMGAVILAGSSAAGCSIVAGAGDALSDSESTETVAPLNKSRTLVAYFSVPETDDPDGMSEDEENSSHVVDGKVLGNTQYVAQLVAQRTGANVFRIETAEELPLDHDTLEDLALEQQEASARPELKTRIPNIGEYDTVFIGYPIWWYDLPMPMYTFLEDHDFTGKDIILFSTHGGSRMSGTDETITKMLPDSHVVQNPLTISRDDMGNAEAEVGDWLDRLGQ